MPFISKVAVISISIFLLAVPASAIDDGQCSDWLSPGRTPTSEMLAAFIEKKAEEIVHQTYSDSLMPKRSDPLTWMACGLNKQLIHVLRENFPKLDVVLLTVKLREPGRLLNHVVLQIKNTGTIIDFSYRQIYFDFRDELLLSSEIFNRLPRVFVGPEQEWQRIIESVGLSRDRGEDIRRTHDQLLQYKCAL